PLGTLVRACNSRRAPLHLLHSAIRRSRPNHRSGRLQQSSLPQPRRPACRRPLSKCPFLLAARSRHSRSKSSKAVFPEPEVRAKAVQRVFFLQKSFPCFQPPPPKVK